MPGEAPKTDVVAEVVYPLLYEAGGGDAAVWKYREKFPAAFDAALLEWKVAKDTIQSQADLGKLQIEYRGTLLVKALWAEWFGSSPETSSSDAENLKEPTLPDALKLKMKEFTFADFKMYHEGKKTEGIEFPEGIPHAITGKKLFDGFDTLAAMTLDAPGEIEKWPEFFPYAPGSRVVLGGKGKADLAKLSQWATPFFEKGGVTLTIVEEGVKPAKPTATEIQVVAMPEAEPLNWDQVKLCQALWKDGETPGQFSLCKKTLAAVQVLEGKTVEEACKFVGLASPSTELLKELVPPKPDAATEGAARDAAAEVDEEKEEEAMESAQAFLTKKFGDTAETVLDFSKTEVISPTETGAGGFDESFEFMTAALHKDEFPTNASLVKEDVAYFVNVPSANGDNSELVALDDSYEVVGYAS